jgi:hypothetical protein
MSRRQSFPPLRCLADKGSAESIGHVRILSWCAVVINTAVGAEEDKKVQEIQSFVSDQPSEYHLHRGARSAESTAASKHCHKN